MTDFCEEYRRLILPIIDRTDPITRAVTDLIICRDGRVYWSDLDLALAGQVEGSRYAYVDMLVDILDRVRGMTEVEGPGDG